MKLPRVDWSELSLQLVVTFGHFLWQACAVAIVLGILEQLSSIVFRRSDNLRYTVACLAFFSLPVCVASTFAWVHQSRGTFLLAASAPIQSPAISTAIAGEMASPVVRTEMAKLPLLQIPAESDWSATQSPEVPIHPANSLSWANNIQSLAPYLLIAYTMGVCLMLTRFGISIVGSSRLRRTLQSVTDSSLLNIIAEQSSRLGLKRVPIVAICQRVSVPVVVGIVRPMILVPPALVCGFDPNQLAAILSHEMAHIRRYDLIVNLLQRIVEALLFFHPVTWWISRRVSIEREHCCDDMAAAYMGRLWYAGALLQMAELCIGHDRRHSVALATLSANGGNSTDFGFRIRRLIGAKETTRVGLTRRSFSIGLALVSLVVVSLVAWGQNRKESEQNAEDGVVKKIFTPEPLWQTKLAANDVASELHRISPVVVAGSRVLSIEKDFDLRTGKEIESTFVRRPRKNVLDGTLDPVFRRRSSDREFLVEVSVRGLGSLPGWSLPSCDIRVIRATDGRQVGTTIPRGGEFDANTCDVDIENGGDFLLLGMGNEVHVYRTETGAIETMMPIKTKRVDAVAFSPDRKWLVVSDQNDLHFWRWRDQAPVKTIHAGRKIDSLVFTPDGQYLAEGPDTREDIQIRDMRTLEVIASLKDEIGSPLMVSSMDITPDERYLVAHNEVSVAPKKMTTPHRIHVWDLKLRGNPVFQIATGEWVRNVAFSDDGRMIVGEFSGATHGALLAAWKLPDELIRRRVDAPSDSKDRLGDGIQWSRWGDKDGLLSGARLVLPEGGLKPGQPLVVEYRLANVSTETKTLKCYLNKGMQFTSLGRGNRIGGFGLDWHREPVTLTIEPGEVFIDSEHLVSINTTGLEPDEYQAALGSAFRYADSLEPNTTHEIPHRGRTPFKIVGESNVKITELPKSDIHWGKPIAGLQLGAKFIGDPKSYSIGATVEADLFVANVTDQPIECSIILPHPADGWLFNVEDRNGDTIMLQRPIPISSLFPEERVLLKLAPGEIRSIIAGQADADANGATRPRPKFEIADVEIDEANWTDYTIKGRLVTQGGSYSAIFGLGLIRPEIPAFRLELDSGNVPFTVVGKDRLGNNTVVDKQSGPIDLGNLSVNVKPPDQQALNQKVNDLAGKREDLVRRIDRAATQRDEAQKSSSEYFRLDYMLKTQELLLAKFDLENATADIVVPNAPEATPERIAALRELLCIRWGLPVDGIQVGLGTIDDPYQFEPSEKISFQVYIRNVTEEQITQKLRWFDAANSTALLRSLARSPTNIFLSSRSGSSLGKETELRLEPGEIRELPRGRFEMDTTGLPPGVYSVDANFPVVFPNRVGESATRIARPIDADGMPFELLFRFELIGERPLPDAVPVDSASEVVETSKVKWGTPVYGLQAGARFRKDATNSGEIDTAKTDSQGSSAVYHSHIGDTVKTEILVRNISSQPIKVRIEAAMGKEVQSLSAMDSGLTQLSSKAIMRRSPVKIAEKSTRTVERTLQPGEHVIAAHQDFEIQQLVDGRESQLSLPEVNRHWVPGQGDYMYHAYLKLGITDSLSISLHSGGIGIRIDADNDPQGANQAITTETNVSSPGKPPMNNDLKEISDLIASGKTIPRELNEKYQAAHLNLTAAERLKSVKLLTVPDFVMQVLLSEPTYSYAEKVALLSELKGLNFGSMEFGLQEWLANVATEYAKVDPAATREWLAMFQGAEYGVGMGLTAVLEAAKQKDPAMSLEILRSLDDTEGECIVTSGDIPKYDLPASDWLKEVQRFQSQRLRSYFLGGPMVFRFGEESPEAALDYILTIPKETRNQQLGYQLVSSLLRSKRFTWTEILDWMETKLPIETRSPEHYGLLSSAWSQQDNTTFQTWFQSVSDSVIRDEVIIGFTGAGQTREWPEILKLATSIRNQTKRQAKVAWALDAWKLTDPEAALAQLDNADISKERRTQLHRDITARLAQIANAQPVSENANPQQTQGQRSEKPAGREEQILGQWDVSPKPAKTGIVPQAESMTLKFSEQGKFESYVQKQNSVEFATGTWKLDGNKVSVRFKPFAMQPTNNSVVEATLQYDTPDTLILDGTRFLKRSVATPVALDAKHPLHGIAKDVLSKLNVSASLPENANDIMRMLNTRSPLETWQLVQLSDKPAMSATQGVDRFDATKATGYRLLFSRDYYESADTMQQAVLKPTALPFRVRTEQLEIVLFADQPSKAPPELRSRIAWLPAQSRWPTHDICLGDGLGYTWFVRAPLQIVHSLKSGLQLAGGDDMIASLVQMTISMKGLPYAADANTSSGMLASYGDRAVTAVEQAVRKKKPQEDLWHTIGSLADIRTDLSTKLLIQLYQSEDADIRNAATYALIHVPYRQAASQVYLDLLKNRMRVEEASAACIALGLKDAIPILKELFANASKPSSLRELNTIFTARRTLEGNPVPKELLEASQTIFLSSAVDATDQGSAVGKAIQQFKDSKDEEAVVVLALQLVGYTNKANVNHICVIGAGILREKKQGPSTLLFKSILDSHAERERVEVLKKIQGK